MARQGYYIATPERSRPHMSPQEWAYWYDGAPAKSDLLGPAGEWVVRVGARRAGGSYRQRASRIAVWNTTMDEYNYATRAWDRFIGRVQSGRIAEEGAA